MEGMDLNLYNWNQTADQIEISLPLPKAAGIRKLEVWDIKRDSIKAMLAGRLVLCVC